MLEILYLAECSNTYRSLIPRLVRGYVRKIVDLWENPSAPIEMSASSHLLMVDEAFVVKGPGPARTVISSLLETRRIVTIPRIVLRRRETQIRELPHGVFQLRRPFYAHELEEILNHLCPKGRKVEEMNMSENQNCDSPLTPSLSPKERVSEEVLQALTREAIEKVVREMVPPIAEKIVLEEIRRLTE
jgi:hypothetical protein